MAIPDNKDTQKPLPLVTIFKEGNSQRIKNSVPGASIPQNGYQLVDAERVLFRQSISLSLEEKYIGEGCYSVVSPSEMKIVTLYDFHSCFITTMYEHVTKGVRVNAGPPLVIPFSAVEREEAIYEAHRALTELGGNPPSLDGVIQVKVSGVLPRANVPKGP